MDGPARPWNSGTQPRARDRWLGVEMRHFAALAAIASERSFRRGAERLGYVQSAISRQIAYLEQVTGTRLIERSQGPGPVHLTDAGEVLLAHANDILANIDAAQNDLEELDAKRTREVRVGFFPGVPTHILPPTLVAFGRRHPGVRVVAHEAVSEGPLLSLVRKGSIDLSFSHLPTEPGPFECCELLQVPWVLVVPADDDLAKRGAAPTPEEIARLPVIGGVSSLADPWRKSRLAAKIGDLRMPYRFDGAEIVQALAGAGLGAAVVPRLAVQESDPRTAVIDLGHLLPPSSIGLVWPRHRRLDGTALRFRQVASQVCAALADRQSES
jgi:DNA-binding transcriptional LysR family regulator